MRSMEVTIAGETILLHPLKGLYWPRESTLMLADLHLGKATHFRREGIAVPTEVRGQNLKHLHQLMADFEVQRLLFLGDLFHSNYNQSWEHFDEWMQEYPGVDFELVMGNHDILTPEDYQRVGLKVHPEGLKCGPFWLTHEPIEKEHAEGFNLAGHWHPGVRLHGLGRQSLRLPCFYFNRYQGVLPAFGAFTGKLTLQPRKGDKVYVVAEQEVVAFTES